MSKLKMNCGYCGRKCDLDKDFCTPQDSVYVCKSCYDRQNRVTDLEAKLAESEKSCIVLEGLRKSEAEKKDISMKRVAELKQQLFESGLKTLEEIKLSEQRKKMLEDLSTKNWELEQQLAEKETEIKSLSSEISSLEQDLTHYKGEVYNLKDQLAEKENTITNLIEDSNASKELLKKQLNEQAGLCEEFRFQLAEKDKEIEYLNKQARKFNNEAQKYFEDAYCNDSIYQDKISFCIEWLENCRLNLIKLLNKKRVYLDSSTTDEMDDLFDNQIEELKKEMK